MQFNQSMRDKQIEFLDSCDSKEQLGRESIYIISDLRTKQSLDTCQCAGTAIMLLSTTYKNINVWVKKG